MSFRVPESMRAHHQDRPSHPGDPFGFFLAPFNGVVLWCVACSGSAGSDWWDHVSVSVRTRNGRETHRTPTWEEMVVVRRLFWEPEDCVLQFHPPESAYVNRHEYVLHLWRPNDAVKLPPTILI